MQAGWGKRAVLSLTCPWDMQATGICSQYAKDGKEESSQPCRLLSGAPPHPYAVSHELVASFALPKRLCRHHNVLHALLKYAC